MMNCSMYYTMRYFLRSGKDKCSGKKDIRHIRVFFIWLLCVCSWVYVHVFLLACVHTCVDACVGMEISTFIAFALVLQLSVC